MKGNGWGHGSGGDVVIAVGLGLSMQFKQQNQNVKTRKHVHLLEPNGNPLIPQLLHLFQGQIFLLGQIIQRPLI